VKATPTGSAEAEKQLKRLIDKFEPKHRALIREMRKILRRRMPSANELAYDNYNFFVLGYCPTELFIQRELKPNNTNSTCMKKS
jgi:hypothetical protein